MLREKYCSIFANLLNAMKKYKYWFTINVYEISVVYQNSAYLFVYRDIFPCKCYTNFNFDLNSFLQETQPWSISPPTEQTTWTFLQPHQQMLYTMVFEATTTTAMTKQRVFLPPPLKACTFSRGNLWLPPTKYLTAS